MAVKLKPLTIDGDEYASLCHWMHPNGRLVIDVKGDTLSPTQARWLAEWLTCAASAVENQPRVKRAKQERDV